MTRHEDEFTKITVNLRSDDRVIVVVPKDELAAATLQQVLEQAPASLVTHSKGLSGSDEFLTGAYLCFGGESYRRTEGNVTTIDYDGAIKVYLDLSDVDQSVVAKLRGYMWYGIAVDPESSVDNFMLLPSSICKVCQKDLNRETEMEWLTCDNCAAKCGHDYVEGLGQVNGHIAHMPFCKLCGRGDPEWQPSENPMDDVLNTVASGDLTALVLEYPDGSSALITKK